MEAFSDDEVTKYSLFSDLPTVYCSLDGREKSLNRGKQRYWVLSKSHKDNRMLGQNRVTEEHMLVTEREKT